AFDDQVKSNIAALHQDRDLHALSRVWTRMTNPNGYTYNFKWLGRPIIQYPQDIVSMQELIFRIQPDLIIETGIAHGGSLIFSASMLELSALCGGPQQARVIGVDIDIRSHNRAAIDAHPLKRRITMLEGSSGDPAIVGEIAEAAREAERVLCCLDSNHTHEHVLAELNAYAPLVTVGSYCVVFDTLIELLPASMFTDRPWKPGDSPMTAVDAFLANHPEFEIDSDIDAKLLISVAPRGYLRRVA